MKSTERSEDEISEIVSTLPVRAESTLLLTITNKRSRKCDGLDWENISLREMLQTQQVTSTMKAVLLMTRFK